MADPAGESNGEALRLDFDRRLMLQFRGSVVTSDAGLLAHRELDDALGLTTVAGEMLADARTGRNGRHALVGLFRQSVFGRLAGYEDVNDAERLRHDPAMRWIVGGKATSGCAASPSQMGRFETRWLTAEKNLSALSDLSGRWIDCVHARRPPKGVVLDMDILGITITLPEALTKHIQTGKSAKPTLQFAVPLSNGMSMNINIGEGLVSNEATIVMDTTIVTTTEVLPDKDAIVTALNIARDSDP
jgi:Transposase DDE domain group 1